MKKRSLIYLVLALIGFLFVTLGGVFLILGVFLDNTIGIYVGLGLALGSIAFYVILGIVFFINYFRKRR